MSNPEVGSAFVKLQLDPADFEEQIVSTAEAGAEKAQAEIDKQTDQVAQSILDLRTRSEAANLRALAAQARGQQTVAEAEILAAGLLNLQANIAQAQFAAEDALRSAAAAMGAEKEQFLAAADAYKTAAQIGQDTLERSRRAGRIVEPNVPGQEGQGGVLGQLGGLLGSASAGRTGGLGGITALITRLGPLGLAAGAAFQAFNELQSMLRVTGDEAFTTSGKIRNAASDLTSLNIIGAFKSLTADRPAELSGALTQGLEEIKQKSDDLFLSEEKLLAIRDKSEEGLQIYLSVLASAGHISEETAAGLDKVVNQLFRQREAALATENALANYNEQLARASSEAAQFGERGNEFGRGAGAIEREAQRVVAQGGPTPLPGTGGTQVGNEIRASIASRIADDQKRTALELENAKTIQAQRRQTFENVRNTEAAAGAWKDYVLATTEVTKATQAAKQATQAAAEAAQDAANTVRDAQAGRIRDEGARLQAELANARIVERQKQAAARAAQGTEEAAKANAVYEQAITSRVALENQIKDRNEAAATAALEERRSSEQARLSNAEAKAALTARAADDIAAIKATRDYYLNLAKTLKGSAAEAARGEAIAASARLATAKTGGSELQEQLIQNAISAASLTSRLSDDRAAAQKLVTFWKQQVEDATGVAKARAEGGLLDAQGRLDSANQARVNLDEQRIQNRINRARLTADRQDDKDAADALVRFWQKQFKNAEAGADKVAAESKLIAAKLAQKGLEGAAGDTGPSTIDFLGISQQIFADFASNLLPTGSAASRAGLFQLPGITAGVGGPEEQQVDELKRIRELLERNGAGARVEVNQSFREPDQSGFAQARFARFAMEEAFNG